MSTTINKTFYTCSTKSLFLRYKKISKKVVKLGSFLQCSVTYISRTWWRLLKNQFKNFMLPYHEKLLSKAWSVALHHITQNIFFWKLQVIIRPFPCWQQDSLLLTSPGIYPQIYHRTPCPSLLICKGV